MQKTWFNLFLFNCGKIDKIDDINNPENFLLRSTKFKCIDFLRKQTNNKQRTSVVEDQLLNATELSDLARRRY